jgi:two-component system chemotaxis response regulator CheB
MEGMQAIGTPSVFSCPECSGTLWEVGDDDLPRFRCDRHADELRRLLVEERPPEKVPQEEPAS